MIELIYFSSFDLMIMVEYIKKSNTLRYASHRGMESNEREKTERHIMSEFAPKTDFHEKPRSQFSYLGVNKSLQKRLASFNEKKAADALNRNEEKISALVDNLIHVSMCNYYSEKIGDLIVTVRHELNSGRQSEPLLNKFRQNMDELLSAYNLHADRALAIDDVIPLDLKSFWFDGKNEPRGLSAPSMT